MANETVITVIGNLTSDPELRYTQNGLAVANFTIASTPKTLDKQTNEWKDGEALFLRASVWKEFAEHVANSLQKGSRVIAQGNLKQRSYETKEGEKRTSFELDVQAIGQDLRFGTTSYTTNSTGRGETSSRNSSPAPAADSWAASTPAAAADTWNTGGSYNDETPF